MKGFAACTLIALVGIVPVASAQFIVSAEFDIAHNQLGRMAVSIDYRGTVRGGDATATYTDESGNVIVDDMRDCKLTLDIATTSLACTNPHLVTWDAWDYNFISSSERMTDGLLQVSPIVSDIRQFMQHRARQTE
jgi:hypothetical protein